MSVKFLNDHRICFIGDSFVQGTGDSESLGWVGRVAAKAQAAGWTMTPYNLSVRRDTRSLSEISDPEHNCRIQELSEAFGELAEHIGVPYLSVYDRLENDAIWKKDVGEHDGAHPGVNGYSQLANLVRAWSSWWFHGN